MNKFTLPFKQLVVANRLIVLILFVIVFISPIKLVYSQTQLDFNIEHDGLIREYTLYIPLSYNTDEPVPLVFNIHGYGGNGPAMLNKSGLRPVADSNNFIVVCPQGTNDSSGKPYWNRYGASDANPLDDFGFIDAVIDEVLVNYSIDETRIYSTGFSMGSFLTYALPFHLSHRFAAIAPVSGTLDESLLIMDSIKHATPVLIINGTKDPAIPYAGVEAWGMPSVDSLFNFWTIFNHCDTTLTFGRIPDIDANDGSRVEHYYYDNGDNGASVDLFKIIDGKHHWPGFKDQPGNQDIDAGEEIWAFFKRFSLESGQLHSLPRVEREYEPYDSITSIILSPDTLRLYVGEESELSIAILPDSATDHSIVWDSFDYSVIYADATGRIIALDVGETMIKVMAQENNTICDSTLVIVENPSSIMEGLQDNDDILIYPNPWNGERLTIALAQKSTGSFTLCDIKGNLLFADSFKEQSEVLINPTNCNLEDGIYFAHILCDEKRTVKKIILSK